MENNTLQVLKETELLGQQFTVFGTVLNLSNTTDMFDELPKFNLERDGI